MSKKALITVVIIGLMVIITGALLLSNRDEASAPIETEDLVTISRPPELGGWQLIEDTKFHYAFEIPPNWEAQVIGDDIEARFRTDTFRAVVSVNGFANPENIGLREWIESSRPSEVREITKEGIKGLRYVGQELVESYEDGDIQLKAVKESYLLGNIFQVQDQIVDIQCSVSGPNYKTMIPTCEKIIGGLRFIQ